MPTIYFRTDLNNRLQVSGFYSNNGQVGQSFIDKQYNYAPGQNNGNIMSIANSKDANRSQTFTYDSLNRIKSGSSTANTGVLSWGENYAIDAWGNLMIAPMGGKAHGGNFQCAGDNSNRATCLSYDPAGNVTANGGTAYSYDQENRLSSTAGTNYLYDANGNRMKKSAGSTGTLYWYASPGIIAETDLSGALKSEYVFFAAKRVARIDSPGNSVHYYLADHLSSTTMVVSAAGVSEEESDYSPFGSEYQVASTGANHYKFTGKERDTESGLDYFGARHYSNGLGRFITPDWAAKAAAVPYAEFADPQSLNLYAYVRNLPTSRVDRDGHKVQYLPDKKNAEEANKRVLSNVSQTEKNLFKTEKDKATGRYELKLDVKATANFKGTHTKGFERLVTAINSDKTALVSIQTTVTSGTNNTVFNVARDLGGGATVKLSNGNVVIALAPEGNLTNNPPHMVPGVNGSPVPDPVGIIAGHELLGHGVDHMTGAPATQSHGVQIENQLRQEQGLPPRGPE